MEAEKAKIEQERKRLKERERDYKKQIIAEQTKALDCTPKVGHKIR